MKANLLPQRFRSPVGLIPPFTPRQRIRGFSLVELLVVIAVIAIIAAIAIVNISNLTDSANMNKDRRNAQNVASMAAAARAAGATNVFTVSDVIPTLVTGISTNGMFFSLSPLADAEVTGAQLYLTNGTGSNTNMVLYTPGTNGF